MKPIENLSDVQPAVTALLGQATRTLATTLVNQLLGQPRPAKRRRARVVAPATPRRQRASLAKGGVRRG